MTAVAISIPGRRLTRRQMIILFSVIVAVAALLYFEYRTFTRLAPTTATEADTMCMASRIGLPCR
jgi:hypothetical protein